MVPRRSGLEAVSHVTVNHYVNTTVVVFYWTSAIVFCQISRRSHIQRYFHLRRTANMLCFKWEAFSHMMDRTDVRREFPLWLKRAMGSFDGRNSWANRVTVCNQRSVLCRIWSDERPLALMRWVLIVDFSLVQQVGQWRDAFWFNLFKNAIHTYVNLNTPQLLWICFYSSALKRILIILGRHKLSGDSTVMKKKRKKA